MDPPPPSQSDFDAALQRLKARRDADDGVLPGERPEHLAWERDLQAVRAYCEAHGLDFEEVHREVTGPGTER